MSRDIIDLRPERPDEGEVHYTYSPRPPKKQDPFGDLVVKILGIALGLLIFLSLLVFFVYVVVPLAVILLVWFAIRHLLGLGRRD